MKNSSIYLTINERILEKHKEAFKYEAELSSETKGEYLIDGFPDNIQHRAELNLIDDGLEFNFDTETLSISSEIRLPENDEKLSYLYITIPMDIDTMSKIVNAYVKKLNKLKTVLEATK